MRIVNRFGVVELVNDETRRWWWVRRNQAGMKVAVSNRPFASRRQALQDARRRNPSLPIFDLTVDTGRASGRPRLRGFWAFTGTRRGS